MSMPASDPSAPDPKPSGAGPTAPDARRHERLNVRFRLKYTRMDAGDLAGLDASKGYMAPRDIRANTTETRGFRALADDGLGLGEDLSVGGLKLRSDEALPEGTRLKLEVALDEVPIPVAAVGEVRWCRPDGAAWHCGLMFVLISRSDLDKVERFLVLQKRAQLARRG